MQPNRLLYTWHITIFDKKAFTKQLVKLKLIGKHSLICLTVKAYKHSHVCLSFSLQTSLPHPLEGNSLFPVQQASHIKFPLFKLSHFLRRIHMSLPLWSRGQVWLWVCQWLIQAHHRGTGGVQLCWTLAQVWTCLSNLYLWIPFFCSLKVQWQIECRLIL